MHNINIQLVI